jgi:hypothetical protein
MEFEERSVSYSVAFDPDDPTLIDRHPDYDTDEHLDDRPPTPTQQREKRYMIKTSRKKSNPSAIPDYVSRTLNTHNLRTPQQNGLNSDSPERLVLILYTNVPTGVFKRGD